MQAPVGLFFFSVLLTTGVSLECETCIGQGSNCTGQKENCTDGLDACATLVIESTAGGQTTTGTIKDCFSQALCNLLKPGAVFSNGQIIGTIKEVTCKAPSPSASLLLALSGLLLLKVLLEPTF